MPDTRPDPRFAALWAVPHLSNGVSSGPGGVTAPAADARTRVAMRAGRCTLLAVSSCGCCAGLPTRLAAAGRTACMQRRIQGHRW